MKIFDCLFKKEKIVTPAETIIKHYEPSAICNKYNLIFIAPENRGRGYIRSTSNSNEYSMLSYMGDIHISECEWIIKEIDDALQGKPYGQSFCFDWVSDLDLYLNYPDVELYDLIIPMTDFKLLLQEWVAFNRMYNKDIL